MVRPTLRESMHFIKKLPSCGSCVRERVMSNGRNKEVRVLLEEAISRGWQEIRSKRHIVLIWPETNEKITIGLTLSDHRAIKNMKARLRRIEKGVCADD
jgi:hypothetical protein